MRKLLVAVAGVAALAVAPAQAGSSASLVIRHQVRGCHSWSFAGGAYKPSQSIRLHLGQTLTVTNNDVMLHTLVKLSGPAVSYRALKTPLGSPMMRAKGHFGPNTLAHVGAKTRISFSRAGTYVFRTRAGEDYMPMGPTKGEDNVLRLTVHVA